MESRHALAQLTLTSTAILAAFELEMKMGRLRAPEKVGYSALFVSQSELAEVSRHTST
jgi:hypothetical protein